MGTKQIKDPENRSKRGYLVDEDQAGALDGNPALSAANPVASAADIPTNPLTYKGEITVAADFPLPKTDPAGVQIGWWYSVKATVTDNDPTKTDSGQSFVDGDDIFWNDTDWEDVGPLLSNKADKVGGATLDNFAGLDATGNLKDSGSKASDFIINVDQQHIYYVGKHGNDANTGRNIESAFLTFGAAITEAVAQTPTMLNQFVIECEDRGKYTEDITLSSYVHIHAPNASFEGNHLLADNSIFTASGLKTPATGVCVDKPLGQTGYSRVSINRLRVDTAATVGVVCRSGDLDLNIDSLTVEAGAYGIGNIAAAGTLHANINHIEVTGAGYGAVAAAGSNFGLIVNHLNSLAGTALMAINGGEIQAIIADINASAAIDVDATSSISLVCTNCVGTETVAAGGVYRKKTAENKFWDHSDPSKIVELVTNGITTGNTRTITMPDADVDLGDIGGSIYDVTVDAAGGGDYTTIKAAFDAEGADKSYLIKAGSYTESADTIIPDGVDVVLEAKDAGVVSNKQITTAATIAAESAAAISGAVVTVHSSKDLSDVESNPGDYSLFWRGVEYAVSSASDAAHTITLSTSPPHPLGGSTNAVFWAKDFARDVTMSGKFTTTVLNKFSGFVDSDFSKLLALPILIEFRGCSSTILPSFMGDAKNAAQGTNGNGVIRLGAISKCKFPLLQVSKSAAGTGLYYSALIIGTATDEFTDLSSLHVLISDMKTDGGGWVQGIKASAAICITASTITGVVTNTDANTQNIGNANTAGLYST
jgi:hypothetical protein